MTGHDAAPGSWAIHPGMTVITAEGEVLGSVSGQYGRYVQCRIPGDDRQHFIPLDAVAQVGDAVHLHLTHQEVLGLL
ncbi:DUF2171 domain-containing protein [Deinococcus radiotolerans]|uniref:DUF2171 domain-containing protein n=1 Tax=Deinococcus radiotolerans TaxID=1309407 RepID=A0ABQ2FIH0_9DEIO|nr:DUF2171 domain-containing protein [Deinococcus radiotolerans]GGK99266.1 hypothetical protein GCM10010844_16890 [Deinococcus radiotolerans]